MNQERSCQEYTLSSQKTDPFVGPHQHKRYNLHFPQIRVFLRTTMLAKYCPENLETISLTFSQNKRGWQLV